MRGFWIFQSKDQRPKTKTTRPKTNTKDQRSQDQRQRPQDHKTKDQRQRPKTHNGNLYAFHFINLEKQAYGYPTTKDKQLF